MQRVPVLIGKALIAGALILCVGAIVIAVAEFALAVREGVLIRNRSNWPTTRIDLLKMWYYPFTIQHLHPQYLFFFPLDPAERVGLSNQVVHLDQDGFRGHGPAFAGSRKLAFIVGGSAAFGDYASSDETTISGYLNALQKEYFFVNAGVPSWNSTQDLFRVAFQLATYRPSLVIAYNGPNDASILAELRHGHPPGTPESFEILAGYFDDLRGRPSGPARTPAYWFDRLIPQVSGRVNRLVLRPILGPPAAEPERVLSPDLADAGAGRLIENQRRMRDLIQAGGGRLVWVYQPHRALHTNIDGVPVNERSAQYIFHRTLVRKDLSGLEFHDFSSVFDRFFARVPVLDGDLTDSTIFVDEVHLYDPGNAIIARELWRVVCAGTPRPTTGCL